MAAPTADSSTSLSGGSGITMVNLLKRVVRRLQDHPYEDTVTANAASNYTSLTVASDATTRGYEAGDRLDFLEDGSFDIAVISAIAATSLTARGGALGSTQAAHTNPAVFRKNPRFFSKTLEDHANMRIKQLWPDISEVFVSVYTLSAVNKDLYYALPSAAERVLFAYQMNPTTPPDEILEQNLIVSQPRWVHSGLASTKKTVRIDNLDYSNTSLYVVHANKPTISTLTDLQVDILELETAVSAMEAAASIPSHREDGAVFDEASKIQLWRREARELRQREAARLRGYAPAFSSRIYAMGRHYRDL